MNRNTNLRNDVWIYRITTVVLGMVVLASLIGAIVLALEERTTPEMIVALGSAAIGSLAGLLVPSPLRPG